MWTCLIDEALYVSQAAVLFISSTRALNNSLDVSSRGLLGLICQSICQKCEGMRWMGKGADQHHSGLPWCAHLHSSPNLLPDAQKEGYSFYTPQSVCLVSI